MDCSTQDSLSIINSQSLLKLMSTELVMPPNHLILCRPPLLLPSIFFPASGSFSTSQFFTSGGQRIGVSASASVRPMSIQDLFPLGWTGWISLQSKGLSRVFSSITVQEHQFFGAQLMGSSPNRIQWNLQDERRLWMRERQWDKAWGLSLKFIFARPLYTLNNIFLGEVHTYTQVISKHYSNWIFNKNRMSLTYFLYTRVFLIFWPSGLLTFYGLHLVWLKQL